MASDLVALCFGAREPSVLAAFWSGLLDRRTEEVPGGTDLVPDGGADLRIRFVPFDEPKAGRNQTHLHLTSTSPEDQDAIVRRALALGGGHLDVGQLPEEGHIVLADPEGNEFCVIEPGNSFLAGTAPVGELSCDGSPAVGRFWSAALDWPLVWDQDEETAIQSPRGGTKISWGGPPYNEKRGSNRLFLTLAPVAGDAQQEAERLVLLGAGRVDRPVGGLGGVAMTDPGGNEFVVLESRPARPAPRPTAAAT
ncbi:VOC family protein [Aeromicrobium chenweiae]|uniref:Bleomycin resistance protein n=1 Tax=Aeromicrobium chenweiae TaxID=2079793 RepID=A0A2S0WIX4_9ACTN|nr:VOC family protein [Aeromicrobium chenweiae]AWB91285.1 bleomycin resistance protein [Aeromicrobium chenweiae]TGN31803.1 VOC family protein [Aeromicrobium chenweiae]